MIYISPTGEVNPCSFLDFSFGNLYKNNLKEIILSEKRKKFLNKQLARDFGKKCFSCDLRFLCGGCRARALSFNNNLWGDDPFCFKDC